MTVTIKAKALEAFVADIFAAAGCSTEEGGRIGRYLVSANLSGHDSHGVVRVPRYAVQKKNGTVVADVTVDIVVDTPVIAVVDGKYGFGQTVTPQAVRIGIDKARKNGLSAVTLRNAGHVGRVGDWAEMAAAEGLVSIHFVNASGSVLVAPHGGVDRRFSTAPYCVGIPRPGQDPLLLDFATSIVAEGKVLVASQGGKKVPEGALIGPFARLRPGAQLGAHLAPGRAGAPVRDHRHQHLVGGRQGQPVLVVAVEAGVRRPQDGAARDGVAAQGLPPTWKCSRLSVSAIVWVSLLRATVPLGSAGATSRSAPDSSA